MNFSASDWSNPLKEGELVKQGWLLWLRSREAGSDRTQATSSKVGKCAGSCFKATTYSISRHEGYVGSLKRRARNMH